MMDQLPRPDGLERIDAGDQTVSRRSFFNRARLGLLAVAGVAVFGIATTTGGVTAKETSDEDKEKKEKDEKTKPRDKDAEAKEKEKEATGKEEKTKDEKTKNEKTKDNKAKDDKAKDEKVKEEKSSNKTDDNKSNTKKKNKNSNGDNPKKQKPKTESPPASPYEKYIVKGEDKFGCSTFPNQADAQAVLRIAPKDPNNLDGNKNGIACDGNDAFMDSVPGGLMQPPFDLTPVARP
jgi:hypothetical protein